MQRVEKEARDRARMKRCACCGREFLPGAPHRPSPYCSRLCANRTRAERERATWREEDRGYETPCWIWQGALNRGGYGKTSIGNRPRPAHRWIYEQYRGPIPAGLHLDHLCEQRACVNPNHCDPCSRSENTRRSWKRGRHDAKRKAALT